jgi:hypothetical protein
VPVGTRDAMARMAHRPGGPAMSHRTRWAGVLTGHATRAGRAPDWLDYAPHAVGRDLDGTCRSRRAARPPYLTSDA